MKEGRRKEKEGRMREKLIIGRMTQKKDVRKAEQKEKEGEGERENTRKYKKIQEENGRNKRQTGKGKYASYLASYLNKVPCQS